MRIHLILIWALALVAFPLVGHAQVPVFEVTPVESTINFDVEASVAIKGGVPQVGFEVHLYLYRRITMCLGN